MSDSDSKENWDEIYSGSEYSDDDEDEYEDECKVVTFGYVHKMIEIAAKIREDEDFMIIFDKIYYLFMKNGLFKDIEKIHGRGYEFIDAEWNVVVLFYETNKDGFDLEELDPLSVYVFHKMINTF
jgi:isocitrate/isopropylmalate dehydrogenase